MARSLLALILGGTLASFEFGSTALAADGWQESAQRAQRAIALGQYDEALRSLSEAYGNSGPKELLLDIGQVYIRLGQPKEARTACYTYLNLASAPAPAHKAAAERCLAEAAHTPAHPRTPPPLPNQPAASAAAAPTGARPSEAGLRQGAADAVADGNGTSLRPAMPFVPPPAKAGAPAQTAAGPARPAPVPAKVAPPPPVSMARADVPPQLPPPVTIQAVPPVQPPAAVVPASPPPPSQPTRTALAKQESGTHGENPYAEYERCLHHQRAGERTAAHDCYHRFLPMALRHGGIAESNIGPLMAELTRFPEPAAVYPVAAPNEGGRKNPALFGAGLSLWLAAMVPPLVLGPYFANQAIGDRKPIFYTLMVPVIGPFISGLWLGSATRWDTMTITHYTVPWIVGDGLTQIAGLAMFIVGLKSRPRSAPDTHAHGNVRITPYASGQTIGVAGAF